MEGSRSIRFYLPVSILQNSLSSKNVVRTSSKSSPFESANVIDVVADQAESFVQFSKICSISLFAFCLKNIVFFTFFFAVVSDVWFLESVR